MNRMATSPRQARLLPLGVRSARRGAISLILVIAVLIIGSLILTESVRTVLNERRAIPRQFERQQAEQILQAGLRKVQQWDSIDDVQAGTWSFAKGVIHPDQTGSLQIQISQPEANDAATDQVSVTITARYPLEADAAVSVSTILTKQDWEQ